MNAAETHRTQFGLKWKAGLHFSYTENASYYAELDERHKELVGETVEVGLMFASKAFVQLLVNPIVGPLTHKYVIDDR